MFFIHGSDDRFFSLSPFFLRDEKFHPPIPLYWAKWEEESGAERERLCRGIEYRNICTWTDEDILPVSCVTSLLVLCFVYIDNIYCVILKVYWVYRLTFLSLFCSLSLQQYYPDWCPNTKWNHLPIEINFFPRSTMNKRNNLILYRLKKKTWKTILQENCVEEETLSLFLRKPVASTLCKSEDPVDWYIRAVGEWWWSSVVPFTFSKIIFDGFIAYGRDDDIWLVL